MGKEKISSNSQNMRRDNFFLPLSFKKEFRIKKNEVCQTYSDE